MSARTVTIEQASEQLAELIERAGAGDDVVILRDNRPAARLLPIHGAGARQWGSYRDVIQVPDDFDEPLGADFWVGNDA